MSTPGDETRLLILWITFTAIALAGVIAVFIWALRSGQFRQQDRARHLALRSEIPPEEPPEDGEK